MEREYEYKFYEYNKEIIIKQLLDLGALQVHDFVLYKFTVFNNKKYIRVRTENDKILLTVKIHDEIFPIEKQIEVNDYIKTIELIELLGFKIKYQFEKLRQKFVYNNIEIVFDMYPGLPEYMEIEAKSIKELNEFCKLLNLSHKNNKWKPLIKMMDDKYGITKIIEDLTFSNAEEKIKPLIKKNMDFFENLINIQKKYIE